MTVLQETPIQYFRVGRLLVGDGSSPQTDMMLVVRDDRVEAVLPAQTVDSQVDWIDLRNYTMLPGLIDAHTHIMADGEADSAAWRARYYDELIGTTTLRALQRAQTALRAGFTTLRDLGSREYIDVAVRDAINEGTFIGPRLLVSGVPITSTGGHFDNIVQIPGVEMTGRTGLSDSPAEARRAARYQVKMGVDLLKLAADGRRRNTFATESTTYQELSFDEMRAVCEVAEWAGIHVAAHTDGGPAMRAAVQAGVRTIEHIQDLSAADAAFFAEQGVYLVPTLTATYNTMAAGQSAAGLSAQHYSFFVENWEAKKRGMQRALAHGVKIVLGTDAGYRFCHHGENAKELLLLVETGMTPMQAIVAATGGAAAAIGLADQLGTLQPDKLADFVVVAGDPIADISLLTRQEAIQAVYKGGQLVDGTQMGTPMTYESTAKLGFP